ncbi:MAG: hypothetical protein ABSD68_02670 [Candidatus Micrarchaeales archaeon]|jgi:hypothetical protein
MSFYGLMLVVTILILTFYLLAFMNEIALLDHIANVYSRMFSTLFFFVLSML